MNVKIHLSVDEVRRLLAWRDNYHEAFYQGDIMAEHLQDDDEMWDAISAGNDYNPLDAPNYGIYDDCGPFEIWDATTEDIEHIQQFLDTYPTVEDVIDKYLPHDDAPDPTPFYDLNGEIRDLDDIIEDFCNDSGFDPSFFNL